MFLYINHKYRSELSGCLYDNIVATVWATRPKQVSDISGSYIRTQPQLIIALICSLLFTKSCSAMTR